MLARGPAPRVLTVSQLAARIRDTLEALDAAWVAGEISNWKRASSGHGYFTLKDDQSQLAAVIFRSALQTVPFEPRDGMHVLVLAHPNLYPARGTLQLYVDRIEPRGLGALQLALEQLKTRLAAEGLFAAERKRPLPRFPRAVGIVTALGGAAIHDLRIVLRRRWPLARVVVRPVRVQGREAAVEIAAAIGDLQRAGGVDVIVAGRGGGSLEDLWAFNEEVVARAIAACAVPVVSAVGHEIDVTVADLVADARAPTPTAAATLVVPDRAEVAGDLGRAEVALRRALGRRVAAERQRLGALERGLGDPRRRVRDVGLRLDDLERRTRTGLRRRITWEQRELATIAARLDRAGPSVSLERARTRLRGTAERLGAAATARVARARALIAHANGKLEVLSPLACLRRGYAIVHRGDASGPVVRAASALAAGDAVTLVFGEGRARARVDGTEA